jgi:hypothetical protein
MNDEQMNAIIEKCLKDPEFQKIFEQLLGWSQRAAMTGMTVEEMAGICMMGYAIGEDPDLQKMVEHMIKIGDLGLDIK